MTFYKNKTHCIKQWPVSYSTQAELWSWSFSGEVYGPTGSGSNPSCVECHKIVRSGWSTATQRQKNTCTGNLQPLYVELGRCLVLKMSRSAEKSHTLRFRETRMQFSEGWPVTLSAATLSFNLHLNHWQMWHWFTEVFNSLRPENPHRFKCKRNNISLIFAQWCQQVGAMRGPYHTCHHSWVPGCCVKSGHSLRGGDPLMPVKAAQLWLSVTFHITGCQ